VVVAQDRERELRRLANSLKSQLTIEDLEILSYIVDDAVNAIIRLKNAFSKLESSLKGSAGGYGYADRDFIYMLFRTALEETLKRRGVVEEEEEVVEIPEDKVLEITQKLKSVREKK